jgi:hypothetical protein
VIDAVLSSNHLYLYQYKHCFGSAIDANLRCVVVCFQPKAQGCPNRKPNGIGLRQSLPTENQNNIYDSSLNSEHKLLRRGHLTRLGCALVLQHRRSD